MSLKAVTALVNGQTYNLVYDESSGMYTTTVTAPSKSSYKVNDGHYYAVSITATDTAGNSKTINDTDSSLGNSLKLKVKEKTAPVISITAPTAGALITNNKPAITWTVTDADSGVNSDTIGITIDSGSKITSGITKTATSNGYTCSYTPATALADGSHTLKFDASDNDGNAASQASRTFKIDTVPPTLSITSPTSDLVTNKASLTVSGTTNDATSSPVTVAVKLNNGTAQEVTVASDGSFSKAITLVEGSNTITVVAKDGANKTTTVTRTVTLDTVAPKFESVTITPNPVDAGQTFIITVKVSD